MIYVTGGINNIKSEWYFNRSVIYTLYSMMQNLMFHYQMNHHHLFGFNEDISRNYLLLSVYFLSLSASFARLQHFVHAETVSLRQVVDDACCLSTFSSFDVLIDSIHELRAVCSTWHFSSHADNGFKENLTSSDDLEFSSCLSDNIMITFLGADSYRINVYLLIVWLWFHILLMLSRHEGWVFIFWLGDRFMLHCKEEAF